MAKDEAMLRERPGGSANATRRCSRRDSIPEQQLDTQVATVRPARGTLKSDQAQIDSAKLQSHLQPYHGSRSRGRVGLRLVDPGNIVHAGDQNGLVVITQVQPIAVLFTIPEDDSRRCCSSCGRASASGRSLGPRSERSKLATGRLLTVDNQIDPTTGTIS